MLVFFSRLIIMGIENFSFLAKKLPGFRLHGSQIRIIQEPSQFYQELLTRSELSEERIVMSALYWGTETREKKLRDAVSARLSSTPGLRVKILLDWCRGSRMVRGESSVSLLQSLVDTGGGGRCRLSFYQTPQLRGPLNRVLPSKWNELIGLQHCKVYIFDDSVIVSGANLSQDYFTNRQDRYVLIENCRGLADYYEELIDNVAEFSFTINKSGIMEENSKYRGLSFKPFVKKVSDQIHQFISSQQSINKINFECSDREDTFIFPTVQMGLYNVNQDCEITSDVLQAGANKSVFYFATGYFNLIERYMSNLIETSKTEFNILMAHPQANGFLGARFPAGGIPHAYTLMASQFLQRIRSAGLGDRIGMYEYRRRGWTFHGKGVWYCEEGGPLLTMVGSPNFGYRSEKRDLESQVCEVMVHNIKTNIIVYQGHHIDNQQRLARQTEG